MLEDALVSMVAKCVGLHEVALAGMEVELVVLAEQVPSQLDNGLLPQNDSYAC